VFGVEIMEERSRRGSRSRGSLGLQKEDVRSGIREKIGRSRVSELGENKNRRCKKKLVLDGRELKIMVGGKNPQRRAASSSGWEGVCDLGDVPIRGKNAQLQGSLPERAQVSIANLHLKHEDYGRMRDNEIPRLGAT